MTIIDIRKLSDRAVAIIDERSHVTIAARKGATLPLSPAEGRQLQAFLNTNEARLIEACGGAPIRERVKVWLPDTAYEAIDKDHRAVIWPLLQANRGHAGMYGRFVDHKETYLGGFSPDGTVFVLIPWGLYEARYREVLLQLCGKDEPDLHQLALRIEQEDQNDDPAIGHPSMLAAAARMQALDVAYWLKLAGEEPTMHDSRDARHRRRSLQFNGE